MVCKEMESLLGDFANTILNKDMDEDSMVELVGTLSQHVDECRICGDEFDSLIALHKRYLTEELSKEELQFVADRFLYKMPPNVNRAEFIGMYFLNGLEQAVEGQMGSSGLSGGDRET